MKKIMIVAVLVFAFAITLNVAFAQIPCGNCGPGMPPHQDDCKCPAINVSNTNRGTIFNTTSATALTGKNIATSSWFGNAGITSGAAYAVTDVKNQIGSNETTVVGAKGPVTIGSSNAGSIMNLTTSSAKTGMNWATAKCGSAGITSGAATAGSTVMNVVGFNVTTIK